MQKISGILSGSARVTTVDMKDAAPVRPGTPAFGRPQGVSSLANRNAPIDVLTKGPELLEKQMELRSQEAQKARIVEDMSKNFFVKNASVAEDPSGLDAQEANDAAAVDALMAGVFASPKSKPAGANYDQVAEVTKERPAPDAFYPKGSFVDTVA